MNRSSLLAISAYIWWGLSAIFWRQLDRVAPVDQVGWRILAGFIVLSILWIHRRSFPFRQLSLRHLRFGLAGAALAATNWGVFLWAVRNDQAVEASLGYFLMPLVSVVLSMVVLDERPSRLQWVAIVLATTGLVWTFIVVGSPPWVALILAASFGTYGLIRKTGPFESVDGLTLELAILTPFALLLLTVRSVDESVTGPGGAVIFLLLAASGLVTVVPLLLFASAARTASLVVVGLLAYLNPVLQFLVGWQLFGESVPAARLGGFAWIWVALVFIIVDQLQTERTAAEPVSDGQLPS